MSKAFREYKKRHGNVTFSEYRRLRRFLNQEDKVVTRGMNELRNLHRKFFVENSWIPKEKRDEYKYSPEFWDWCERRVNECRRRMSCLTTEDSLEN